MKKLLFGITSLTLGGAERVLVDLANELCDQYDITIFTIYAKGELEKQLSKKIKLKSLYNVSYSELSYFKKHFSIPLKLLLFKNIIYRKNIKDNYDLEIAFLEGAITRLFSIKNSKTRKIAWIHNDISLVFGKGIKSKLKKMIDKKIYSKYETLIFVSKDNMDKFKEVYKDNTKKEVIYNYINKENVIKNADKKCDIELDKNIMNFVTVARLVPQKAIDRLISVHTKLINEGLRHKIYVIGDGPEKNKLQHMIEENAIQESFVLLGKTENPYPYIKTADCFALLSYYEGYPMVLLEAQILGQYIIITDTAARETVQSYYNSMIVNNDEESIYQGLKKLIQEKESFEKREEEYSNENIIERIKEIIED